MFLYTVYIYIIPLQHQQDRVSAAAENTKTAISSTSKGIPYVAEYFCHIAKLNQLLVLSQQLEEDIRHLGSHKYIAHQLSVIYVSKFILWFLFNIVHFPHFLCSFTL